MKKLFIIAAAVMMTLSVSASAQGFGVTAGMNFNSAKIQDVKMDAQVGWNLGVTYAVNLPLGFSLQPSLVYSHSGALVAASISDVSSQLSDYIGDWKAQIKQTVGSVVLPVSIQWGPDLLVARPFLDVTPYVGYSLLNKISGEVTGLPEVVEKVAGELDYGIGLGAGLKVWKLQAIVRYNWSFGPLGDMEKFKNPNLGDFTSENYTFGGISVNLSYFF